MQIKSLKQQQYVAQQLIRIVRENVARKDNNASSNNGDAAVWDALRAYDKQRESKSMLSIQGYAGTFGMLLCGMHCKNRTKDKESKFMTILLEWTRTRM